ncbi:hypothetical protein BU16DRAFT_525214 [Lophium mytilinum]|uniref:Rad60/SUMO-like domain-containing protein n=1 Tax=Lophium mytilinum TaxID=390894 RepID=A0A6A6QZ96_9PEZI|nr:hypothetical protein BU16DRAFT_525214 [Lophium mytilinum]
MGLDSTEAGPGKEIEQVDLSSGLGGQETEIQELPKQAPHSDYRATVEDAEDEDDSIIANPSSGGWSMAQSVCEQARLRRELQARVEDAEDDDGSSASSANSTGIDGPLIRPVDEVMDDGFDKFGMAKEPITGRTGRNVASLFTTPNPENHLTKPTAHHQAKKQRTKLSYRHPQVEDNMSYEEEDISKCLQSQNIKSQPEAQEQGHKQVLQETDQQCEPIRRSIEPTSAPFVYQKPPATPSRRQQYQSLQASLHLKPTAPGSRKRTHDSNPTNADQAYGSSPPTAHGLAKSQSSSSFKPSLLSRPVLQPRSRIPATPLPHPPASKHDRVQVVVRGPDGSELTYNIKRKTPMRKLMEQFRKQKGLSDGVVFNFEGTRVTEEDTAESLEIEEDGEVIQVFMIAIGGGD